MSDTRDPRDPRTPYEPDARGPGEHGVGETRQHWPARPVGTASPRRTAQLNLTVVDPAGGVPLYVQVKNQIRLAVERGELPGGAQLPTVRDLAVELNINANTVARIYADLEREGFLTLRRGVGTFAVERGAPVGEPEGYAQLLETLRQLRALGYSRRQVQELTAEALEQLEREQS